METHRIVKVECGAYHTVCVTHDNLIYGFGSSLSGELGLGKGGEPTRPTLIDIKLKQIESRDPLTVMLAGDEDIEVSPYLAKVNQQCAVK